MMDAINSEATRGEMMKKLLIHGIGEEALSRIREAFGGDVQIESLPEAALPISSDAVGDDEGLIVGTDQAHFGQSKEDQVKLFDALFNQAPIGITISYGKNPDGALVEEILNVNPKFEEITGYTKEELLHLGWSKVTHPDDFSKELESFKKLVAGEISSYTMEKRYIRRDGSVVWTQIVVAPIDVGRSDHYNHICLIQDITDRKAVEETLAESERSKHVMLSHLPGMAYRCKNDEHWTMLYVSERCKVLTGYDQENLIGNRSVSFNDIIAPSWQEKVRQEWEKSIHNGQNFSLEYEIITKDGERRWVWELGQGIVGENGEVEELEGLVLSINTRKKMEADLRYHSQHDLTTGLYNRRYLEELLLPENRRKGEGLSALLTVNLSSLHSSAMTYGFFYTHEILKNVAQQLQRLCKPNYTLCVIHEYQFVFLVKGHASRTELTSLASQVEQQLSSFLAIEGIGWGIGILEIARNATEGPQELLRKLLVAGENALQNGSSQLFFDEAMETKLYREEQITGELSKLAAGQGSGRLYLLYQPVVDVKSGKVNGFEALARLHLPSLGTISPLEFIPIAEKTKLIIPLGESIIIEALRFLSTLEDKGHELTVSINISALQLLKPGFASDVLRTVRAMRVNPKHICLEITESIFASNYQEINKILRPLRGVGMKIAIDDFGIGYSSLAREGELEVDCLKVDKFFIDRLKHADEPVSITSDIISMAHKLGHCVIAEGVENEVQLEYLRHHHCDKVQGFLFAKPMEEEAALTYLSDSLS